MSFRYKGSAETADVLNIYTAPRTVYRDGHEVNGLEMELTTAADGEEGHRNLLVSREGQVRV
jgi:hypothetical protein